MSAAKQARRGLVEAAMPATSREIMEKTGLSRNTVYRWLKKMMDAEPREAHIGRWVRTIGEAAPVYVLGPGKDAKRPPNLTPQQLCARYRAKARKDGRWDFKMAMARAKWAANGGKSGKVKHKDPLMALFYRKL